jgi:DNA polymerase I-like protein with 3'-5' exonuclease and polymerase domains
MIQSTVADALNLALVFLARERKIRGLTFKIILAIHDAILLDVPYEEKEVAIRLLNECMCDRVEVPQIGLRYGVDVTVYPLRWGVKKE